MSGLIDRMRGAGLGAFVWFAAVGLLAAPLGGCANLFGDDKQAVLPDEPADKLYNEGLTLLNKSEYTDAAKKFEEVDRQHPYSEWARKSLLMSAFAYYEVRQHEETIQAARRYLALHPGSPDAAYAQYLMASSYFDQIPDITRDQAAHGARHAGARRGGAALSRHRICRKRAAQA
jgi:outer membrane protein assembly factor BamD